MAVERTDIDGLLIVRWPTHPDERGFFRQTYQIGEIAEALGREITLRQGNHSRSQAGTLRGFHAEPWDKLVYVVRGRAFAVIADIRPASPTFGRVQCFHMGDPPDGEPIRLFVSEGLANAFLARGDGVTDYLYDVSAYWQPGVEKRSVAWDDPDLAAPWPTATPLLSDADMANPTLRALYPEHPRWRQRV
jgi:dTDP-4-dehydrorhamnose 3,5-epimerase